MFICKKILALQVGGIETSHFKKAIELKSSFENLVSTLAENRWLCLKPDVDYTLTPHGKTVFETFQKEMQHLSEDPYRPKLRTRSHMEYVVDADNAPHEQPTWDYYEDHAIAGETPMTRTFPKHSSTLSSNPFFQTIYQLVIDLHRKLYPEFGSKSFQMTSHVYRYDIQPGTESFNTSPEGPHDDNDFFGLTVVFVVDKKNIKHGNTNLFKQKQEEDFTLFQSVDIPIGGILICIQPQAAGKYTDLDKTFFHGNRSAELLDPEQPAFRAAVTIGTSSLGRMVKRTKGLFVYNPDTLEEDPVVIENGHYYRKNKDGTLSILGKNFSKKPSSKPPIQNAP